jgi:CarD family transcriptional regulator
MFNVNDVVIYATQGICKIEEISARDLTGELLEYYVLRPVYNDPCTIFVPAGNETLTSKMHRLLSVEEVHDLIKKMPKESLVWIEDERERWGRFVDIISSSDRVEIIRLIGTLYQHKLEQKAKGKKLHVTDERFLCEAEKILHGEFAHILNMRPEQVVSFIREQVGK